MKYVLGLDQGRTKTIAAIADLDGTILSVGGAGGGHHYLTGMEHAAGQMKSAASAALGWIGGMQGDIAAIGGGLAGADLPHDCQALKKGVEKAFSCPAVVVNDCIIALRAETSERSSLIICAGTGLNVGVWAPDGSQDVLGYYIDELWHGGEAIGRRTLFVVMESALGVRDETMLTQKLLDFYGLPDVLTLREKWVKEEIEREKIKDFAIEVGSCAAAGDPVCIRLLEEFAHAWAGYAIAGMKRNGMLDKPAAVYTSGSIFKSATDVLLEALKRKLQAANPQVRVADSVYEPIVGGVILALEKALGGKVSDKILQNVYASARTNGLLRNEKSIERIGE